MFTRLGTFVTRHWILVLVFWVALVPALKWVSPAWDEVTLDGDFAYLPEQMTSVRGARLLEEAFPENLARGQAVLVFARRDGPLRSEDYEQADRLVTLYTPKEGEHGPVLSVFSHQTEVFGSRLVSRAGARGQAVLILIQLRDEFMAISNLDFMGKLYRKVEEVRQAKDFPQGLTLEVTGSAALGADMLFSAGESIQNTEYTTIALVVIILLAVYRAPGLVLVPLITIVASVSVSINLIVLLVKLSHFSGWFDFNVFKTTEIFIIVILFGAGTDFCLFLVARYREEIERGLNLKDSIAFSLEQVGGALAGSAMTTVCGLGMMYFADFGKSRNGGPAIALALAVALLACLTLAPALLRAGGRFVFWPFGVEPRHAEANGRQDILHPELSQPLLTRAWDWLSQVILARPGLILVASVLLMVLPAYKGLTPELSYDLVNELRSDRPSVKGTNLLRQYFLAGETGPVTVLAYQKDGQFDTREGQKQVALLTRFLFDLTYSDKQGREIRPIIAVRSLSEPLGDRPGTFSPFSAAGRQKIAILKHPYTKATYLSHSGQFANKVTRLDLVMQFDPFSRESVEALNFIENQLLALTDDPASEWYGASFDLLGTTAGIRDLEAVTGSDRTRIQRLVVLAVTGVLIVLLRRPMICLYLILSVLFSYYVTMGVTEALFAWFYGPTYLGLDWKVPLFLFVLLIAIGQDYNIYLVTRVLEEQEQFGPLDGLRRALVHTGGIITSCGVIMAGTFVSMLTGTLRGMHELGFALSFGVMLDTMVIRTVLVPAFLVIWERYRAGRTPPVPNSVVEDMESGAEPVAEMPVPGA